MSSVTGSSQVKGDATGMELYQGKMQAKTIVGQREFGSMAGQTPDASASSKAIEAMDTGPYEQRLITAIIKNEIEGAESAQDYLESLDQKAIEHDLTLTEDQQRLRSLVGRLMDDYEAGESESALDSEDEAFLTTKLEWVGELALVPAGTPNESERERVLGEATKTMGVMVVMVLIGGIALLAGFAIGITLFVLYGSGSLKTWFQAKHQNHNVYVETFAIWMVLFFVVFQLLQALFPLSTEQMLMMQPVYFFSSLIVLLWPVIRGIPFSQVREDIGWKLTTPFKDAGTSILSYLGAIPIILPGFLLVFVLMAIVGSFSETPEFGTPAAPQHPIQEFMANGNGIMILFVFITACICAPVIEETMFRGVLYRHLRDLTGKWKVWISVIFAALLNGLIFAACHPQGLFGVPVLAALAIGFSLAREWRDSLLSPMIMHGVHNGLLTCLSLLIL